MTVRVGEKGQVVIPKAIRDVVGIHPGDEVDFELRDGEVVLVQDVRMEEPKPLGGRFAGSGMLEAHMADRAKERERDRW
jgi:AbrB family looped-hinge helix DNA binding protein